ncbi:MAG: hypothetical protein IPN17_23865 [Deltaproteobacteria bacterium]|nr:hypothetical protein [Deltaproteobacteria bacterium]
MVDSELPWGPGAALQSVSVEVRQGDASGRVHSLRTTALGAGTGRRALPLAVGLLPPEEESGAAVWIEVRGCATPDGCALGEAVVVQRAVVRFVAEQTLEVPMLLASACVGVTCAADQRCEPTTGMCAAATGAQATVRAYNGPGSSVGADATVRADVLDGGASEDRPDGAAQMDVVVVGDRPDVATPQLTTASRCAHRGRRYAVARAVICGSTRTTAGRVIGPVRAAS